MDAETTGLDFNRQDIIQLACIAVIDGVEQPQVFNEFCQPTRYDNIDQMALDTHGITVAQMRTFQTQAEMLEKFTAFVQQFKVKFAIAGFNVGFDKSFLGATFSKHNRSQEFLKLFTLDVHDTYKRAQAVKKSLVRTSNLKLNTLAKAYDIPIDAHDALSDIRATMKLDDIISSLLGENVMPVEIDTTAIPVTREFKQPAQLHLHSTYNMIDSLPSVEEWAQWCKENGTPGFSIVDHGNGISMFDILKVKERYGVEGIPGVGLNFVLPGQLPEDFSTVNAWAINKEGYFNLMKLSSLGYTHAFTQAKTALTIPVVTVEEIKKYQNGIIFGTSDAWNAMGRALLAENETAAVNILDTYHDIFQILYYEFRPTDINYTYDHKIGFKRLPINLGKVYNQWLFTQAAARDNLDYCVPVSGAHFIEPEDKIIQDCVSKNSAKGRYYHESYHALDARQIYIGLKRHLGDQLNEDLYEQWINATYRLLNGARTHIKIEYDYHLPEFDIPDRIKKHTDDYNMQTYHLMMQKIKDHGRWRDDEEYVARFKKEVKVIMKNPTLNFIPYFLLYEDICAYARSAGFLQNIARGSAGGSLISYYLKIIHVDPIEKELPFERFLSNARIRAGSFPDIDADFGDKARPSIIRYLQEKYGLGFAQVSTLSRMKTKNAIKDVVWALYGRNRNDPEIKAVCDTIPDSPQGVDEKDFLYGYTDKEGQKHDGVIDQSPTLVNFFKSYPDVERMVKKLIGTIRGWSRHASAFVISTVDLAHSRVPTMTMSDKELGRVTVTQYEASMVEKCGLVKADILGIKTLTAVTECVHLIKERTGKDFLEEDDRGIQLLYRLPEDEGVYADFYNKDTDSSFQFNTNLIKGLIQDFCPTKRTHLANLTALARPGALDAFVEPGLSATQCYIDVRNGSRPLKFLHPDLEPILKDSNGIFCIAENSHVVTDCGLQDIEAIQAGITSVLTEDGSFQTVLRKIDNGYKPTISLRLSQGEELICTPDHEILTDNGWKPAGMLNKNDLIKSFWTQSERTEIGNDKDWLIGLLLADGNLCASSYNVACRSKEEAQQVVQIAQKEFEIEGGLVRFDSQCWYADLRQVNRPNGFFSKKYQKNKIIELCRILNIHKKSCKKKFLPKNYTLSTLAGFFDGDGNLQNGQIRLANKQLAYQLYLAFDSYRIPVSFYQENDAVWVVVVRDSSRLPLKFKNTPIKKHFAVKVPRSYLDAYTGIRRHLGDRLRQHFCPQKASIPVALSICEEIGIDLSNRHTKWSQITKVKSAGIKKVYDLMVENVHSFVVGGSVVHNCYQEEIMRFLVEIVGYTWEESDIIRNAIAKKKHKVMMGAFDKIREGTKKRDWTEEQTETVCKQVQAFSKYSFNKSHSYAYAELGYITMYLKHYYPLEWWTAVLNLHLDSEDKMRKDIMLLGDLVSPPSLENPSMNFVIAQNNEHIIAPISAIKGIGPMAVKDITSKGPFASLQDFIDRVDHRRVTIGTFATLVKARATDCFMQDLGFDYPTARQQLLTEYLILRRKQLKTFRSEFKQEMFQIDPLTIYLMERDCNLCFNKALLKEPQIVDIVTKMWPGLVRKEIKDIPFLMGNVPVLGGIDVAAKLLNKKFDKDVGMILLFKESHAKSGISKRTGKPYTMLKILLSDGYHDLECVKWDVNQALSWKKDSLVYVRGQLKEGWRTAVSMTLTEFEKVEKI